ncbi:MAG: AAA family ATPase [Chloroflexota bacterium]|nr:AAA family ATPase [Chloroflexota bacterium]
MAVAVKKYNPGFLTDDEIIASFCVRTAEFDSLVESLSEIHTSASPHSLVIGPRGSGKTHLLLCLAAEVRRNPALSGLFPVVFAEESYEVATCGELWLECLGRLAGQAPKDERESLRLSYEDLGKVTDDQALTDRAIGALLDFADRQQIRLVLIVENLNMLFADSGDPDLGWRLRQTLQTEPRVILLGSATSRFDEIDNPEHALYDLFRVITLRPLDTAECTTLWQSVAGKSSTTEAVRPLEILTGGNPRLLTIIARFGADRSFRDLMENLLDLVDEHTEYFKSHLETLPPQERRVYLALARLWKPSTTREIADLARLNTSTCSAQLKRLVQRGAVTPEGGTPRRRQYYLTERLYNIYYLLRRSGRSDHLVQALIDFIICLYSPTELGKLLDRVYKDSHTSDTLDATYAEQITNALISKAHALEDIGETDEALSLFDQVIHHFAPDRGPRMDLHMAFALFSKSLLLTKVGKEQDAIDVCNDLVRQFGQRREEFLTTQVAWALGSRSLALVKSGESQKALESFDLTLAYIETIQMPARSELAAVITEAKGLVFFQINRPAEALAALDEAISLYSTVSDHPSDRIAIVLMCKSDALNEIGRTIKDSEFSLLLQCLAEEGSLLPGSINSMLPFIASVEPTIALDAIRKSPAAHLLTPLITALKQELGQSPQVAKEVAEVASDLRRELAKARAKHAQAAARYHAS